MLWRCKDIFGCLKISFSRTNLVQLVHSHRISDLLFRELENHSSIYIIFIPFSSFRQICKFVNIFDEFFQFQSLVVNCKSSFNKVIIIIIIIIIIVIIILLYTLGTRDNSYSIRNTRVVSRFAVYFDVNVSI